MFPHLRAHEPAGSTLGAREEELIELANDAITPDDEGTGPESEGRDNRRVAAGYTYLGQLIAHDVSFDPVPVAARAADPEYVRSFRSPALDLDCIYGSGPAIDGHLYAALTRRADEEPGRPRGLAGYLFSQGFAIQTRDGKNPGERDLPRVQQVVVRLGSANTCRVLDVSKGLMTNLLTEVLEHPLEDVLQPEHSVAVLKALSVRRRLGRATTITVDDSMIQRSSAAPSVATYATPTNGFRLFGHERNGSNRWYDVPPSGLTTIGRASIADPRNDDNAIVSQFHLALTRFHNAVLRRLAQRSRGRSAVELFEEARRIVQWHYQWIVAHDYLDMVLGVEFADSLRGDQTEGALKGTVRDGGRRFLPIEFSAAAFRFGHAMARPSYVLNHARTGPIPLFDRTAGHRGSQDLRGGRPLTSHWSLQWDRFFGSGAQRARRINTEVCRPLLELPTGDKTRSVVELDLLRGWKMGLPSGESVARALSEKPLQSDGDTPLFLYILREAAATGGERLGPVGGRIVGETLLGLLDGDPSSYRNVDPSWSPSREGLFNHDDITFLDIVRFGGLPETADEWDEYVVRLG